jgi:catechol 2,3-dioxygenase-like lactoylglutathione lyase family enzyme
MTNPSGKRAMIRFNGIHHLAMATRDMDGTIRFWRDLLGMRLVAGLGKPGYRHYFFEISANDFLAFFEWPEVQAVEEKDHGYPVKGPLVFDHISFGVETDDDLWTLKERLDAAGFWVSEVIDHGFIHSIYAFDPNGIPIEFSCGAREVDLRKTPRMVDLAPSDVTLEGSEPQDGKWPAAPATPAEERSVYPGEGLDLVQGIKKNWWEYLR